MANALFWHRLASVLTLFAVCLVAPGSVLASDCPGINQPLVPVKDSYQALTVSTTALSLTVPVRARQATLYVEDQPVRWTTDQTTPTASVGLLAKADTTLVLCGAAAMTRFRVIRQGGTDASVRVTYDE